MGARANRRRGLLAYLRAVFAGLAAFFAAGTGCAGACAFGRPVLMDGTACSAFANASSPSAESSLRPARSNSLFLAVVPSCPVRSFSASMAAYSSLGMVKLSRMSLGFLALGSREGLGAAGWAAALRAGAFLEAAALLRGAGLAERAALAAGAAVSAVFEAEAAETSEVLGISVEWETVYTVYTVSSNDLSIIAARRRTPKAF